jgi:superfamily II DNA or RNA helicase
MSQLTRSQILKHIGSSYFAHGESYFDNGNVVTLEIEDEGEGLADFHSEVSGSKTTGGKPKIYTQEVYLNWTDSKIVIEGECSCPVGYNCKHVAAACILYIEQANGGVPTGRNDAVVKQDKTCLLWIDAFNHAWTNHAPTDTMNRFLVYLLKPIPNKTGGLAVDICLTRFDNKGVLEKGRLITTTKLVQNDPSATYLQTVDREIAQIIEAGNQLSLHRNHLSGNLGFLAVGKMLATERCFWLESTLKPLHQSDERMLSTCWHLDDDGNHSLKIDVDNGGSLLLTDPPLYFDAQRGQIGSLKGSSFNTEQLQHLLEAPTIPAALADEFSYRLAEKIPSTVLSTPHTIAIEEITKQAPNPRLYLCAKNSNKHNYHIMRIRFAYNEHELPYSADESDYTLTVDEKRIRIWRDLTAEHKAIEQIKELGFEGSVDDESSDYIFLSLNQRSPTEGASRWFSFITHSIPKLEGLGWHIDIDSSFKLVFHEAENWEAEVESVDGGNDWFDLSFTIEVNKKSFALLPLVAQVLEYYAPQDLPETLTLRLANNEFLTIARERLQPILVTLYELFDSKARKKNQTIESNSLRLSRFDAARLQELDDQGDERLEWRGGEELRQLGKKLKDFSGIKPVIPPKGLNASLRPYQQEGLNWLNFLTEYGFSGILADDMGLGKTVQTLGYLMFEKEQGRMDKPCLIIAPTSLMSNWRREAEQFTPSLKVLTLQGNDRHSRFQLIPEHDLVLSTYPLLHRDEELLLAYDYHILVLDEAQIVKNPLSKAAKAVRHIKTRQRLCLTGTPMENHLGELWALFDFLMPGFLSSSRQFKTQYRTPIEKNGAKELQQQLVNRISPFMLRRAKKDVAKELPEKNEIMLSITLQDKQAGLYESIRMSMEKKVREAIASQGLARSHITILDALLKLRQTCCDPRLLSLSQAKNVKESAKLEWLMEVLPEMLEEGRRILIFSQFTKMLALIEAELTKNDIGFSKLIGQTRHRDAAIEKFKSGQSNVFLISLKAGGVGLNLTEADTVIHYDPWWNPAAENQATDRTHRIGQDKTVFVYKLITENSVEEKIVAMQENKQALAQGIYDNQLPDTEDSLTAEDLQQLFAPMQ